MGIAGTPGHPEGRAAVLPTNGLDKIATDEVGLDELEPALDRVLAGGNKGRTVVRLGGG